MVNDENIRVAAPYLVLGFVLHTKEEDDRLTDGSGLFLNFKNRLKTILI